MNDISSSVKQSNLDQENIFLDMKDAGIPGEAFLKGYDEQISIKQFGFFSNQNDTDEPRGGLTTKKPSLSNVVITKVVDLSSVKLWQALLESTGIEKATFSWVRFASSAPVTYRQIELENVHVLRYEHIFEPTVMSDLPLERIELKFQIIKDTYTQQDTKGVMAGNVSFGWDSVNGIEA
jgi:type VI secretion system Hcp family effector